MMCEGETELCLFKHIKRLFPCSIDVKNPHGRGALSVVREAVSCSGYTNRYVLIDADENTLEEALFLADQHQIQVILLESCSEAVFLQILGEPVPINSKSANLKKQLKKIVGKEPYLPLYRKAEFNKSSLITSNELVIKKLIKLCEKHTNSNRTT